ncbi:aminotransferase-like domain-containing protein [Sphingomonas sp. FUKUSWIS1]|uniref:aminotransferase-like domain-containing protein n=1 Tax=Sphingomonas sp. FUKUSWIS1 TaxID=1379701 RepID=UPI0013622DAC|nr:PLP-dependent aminotransferase family protein [Sphingomonas sp. FUKUSWIS1]
MLERTRQIIDMNRGIPPIGAIPTAALSAITARLVSERAELFQYAPIGGYLGDPLLRRQIADRLGEIDADEIFIGSGSLQVLDLIAATLLDKGPRPVLVEAPTYDRAIGIFTRRGADIHPVPIDSNGINVDRVESLVSRHPGAVLYLIPDFQNPSGATLSMERRHHLARVAQTHGLTIVEDIPYRELRYRGQALPLLRRLAPDQVITLGSFSKTLSPGLRIGYAVCGADLAGALARCAENIYLSPSPLCQAVAAAAMAEGLVERNIVHAVQLLGPRCQAAVAVAKQLFGGELLAEPQGGYFLSLNLSTTASETAVLEAARHAGLILARGSAFMPWDEIRGGKTFLRLPFQGLDPEEFSEGMARLRRILDEQSAI